MNDAETVKKMISQPELLAIKEEAPFVAAQCLLKQDIIKELDHYKVLFTQVISLTLLLHIIRSNLFCIAVFKKCQRPTISIAGRGRLILETARCTRKEPEQEGNFETASEIV